MNFNDVVKQSFTNIAYSQSGGVWDLRADVPGVECVIRTSGWDKVTKIPKFDLNGMNVTIRIVEPTSRVYFVNGGNVQIVAYPDKKHHEDFSVECAELRGELRGTANDDFSYLNVSTEKCAVFATTMPSQKTDFKNPPHANRGVCVVSASVISPKQITPHSFTNAHDLEYVYHNTRGILTTLPPEVFVGTSIQVTTDDFVEIDSKNDEVAAFLCPARVRDIAKRFDDFSYIRTKPYDPAVPGNTRSTQPQHQHGTAGNNNDGTPTQQSTAAPVHATETSPRSPSSSSKLGDTYTSPATPDDKVLTVDVDDKAVAINHPDGNNNTLCNVNVKAPCVLLVPATSSPSKIINTQITTRKLVVCGDYLPEPAFVSSSIECDSVVFLVRGVKSAKLSRSIAKWSKLGKAFGVVLVYDTKFKKGKTYSGAYISDGDDWVYQDDVDKIKDAISRYQKVLHPYDSHPLALAITEGYFVSDFNNNRTVLFDTRVESRVPSHRLLEAFRDTHVLVKIAECVDDEMRCPPEE